MEKLRWGEADGSLGSLSGKTECFGGGGPGGKV